MIAPQFVKPYVKSNKNDANDAAAICEAMSRPSMRFVPATVLAPDEPPRQLRTFWRSRSALLVAAAAVFGVGYFALDRFVLSRRVAEVGEALAPTTHVAAPVQSAALEKSIAVLPFVDMSEKHDQEYFAEGIAEEILDLLVKIPRLTVVGRTSSFQFKGRNED